jgi:hypothetical protein
MPWVYLQRISGRNVFYSRIQNIHTENQRDIPLMNSPDQINAYIPGTQYGATPGKPEKRNRLRYAGFASLCKPLQYVNYHS